MGVPKGQTGWLSFKYSSLSEICHIYKLLSFALCDLSAGQRRMQYSVIQYFVSRGEIVSLQNKVWK